MGNRVGCMTEGLPGEGESTFEPAEAATERSPRAPVEATPQRGESPRRAERSPARNRRLLRRGNTGWEAAGGEPSVRNDMTWRAMAESEPDTATSTGEPARARRSPGQDPRGTMSPDASERGIWSTGLQPRTERRAERERKWRGWGGVVVGDRRMEKGGREKQGDPSGSERRDRGERPGHRPRGVRAPIVAEKRGNARGAKGCRKVEAQRP